MLRSLILATGIVMIAFTRTIAQDVPLGKTICWPLHFTGITVGVNNEPQVVRLLGDGLIRENNGDTGGRIFIDKKHSATLHIVFYTDRIVGDLIVSTGIDNLSVADQKKAESLYFNPAEGFGKWHELHLGSMQEDVTKNLGKPESIGKDGGWRYLTGCSCEIQNYFTIYFNNGRIVKIIFSAPS